MAAVIAGPAFLTYTAPSKSFSACSYGAWGPVRKRSNICITKWQRESHTISAASASDFFDHPLRETNLFFFETSRLELPLHRGAFSLKLVLKGEEVYFLDNRVIRLLPGEMLLINAGQAYGSTIEKSTQSLSIFYTDQDAGNAAANFTGGSPRSAGDFHREGTIPSGVAQARFRQSRATQDAVARLILSVDEEDVLQTDECATALLCHAWGDLTTLAPVTGLAAVRKRATRDELVDRILRARTYMEDMHGRNCSLDELSSVACLSKFHFLRIFREVMRETPSAFARKLRLRAAADAIAAGEPEVTVALRTGFSSHHALRRALRARQRTPRN